MDRFLISTQFRETLNRTITPLQAYVLYHLPDRGWTAPKNVCEYRLTNQYLTRLAELGFAVRQGPQGTSRPRYRRTPGGTALVTAYAQAFPERIKSPWSHRAQTVQTHRLPRLLDELGLSNGQVTPLRPARKSPRGA